MRIEDHALLGDTHSAALVTREGCIDWLCLPRFDSPAVFASLLGTPDHGGWSLRPRGELKHCARRYRPDTLVLETELTTSEGTVRLIDFMPPRDETPDLVRIVEGVKGHVTVEMELRFRFDYGSIIPWVQKVDGRLRASAGPNALTLTTPVHLRGYDYTTAARFTVGPGERVPFHLCWHDSYRPAPRPLDPYAALADTERYWREWAGRCRYEGPYREAVVRSLLTLKALTYGPTGGLVAAPTTSLPEQLGGVRNWDYRFCWLRDASFTLNNLLMAGYREEAQAWRDWLLRAVAGEPDKIQILYGVAGERGALELELPWLPGYEGSKPVRVGNAAAGQLQIDVYGELLDTLHQAREVGLPSDRVLWSLEQKLLDSLTQRWRLPDQGIWETRGEPQPFVYSRVMAWMAFDRAIRSAERFGLPGKVERWKAERQAIVEEVLSKGFDTSRNSFVQHYGTQKLDASLLRLPLVGFLPMDDPRLRHTVEAIERELGEGGFVRRYDVDGPQPVDGLPPGEGAFLACTFWLADAWAKLGERDKAEAIYERLLALRNDVGLLAEEYDPRARRMVGNFPQALSHLAVVNTAFNLLGERGCVSPSSDPSPSGEGSGWTGAHPLRQFH